MPAHRKSGNREVTLGISKRGDRYLRTLLIHGARAVVSVAEQRRDARSVWVSRIKQRQHGGTNIAAVALANKNARVLWALLSRNDSYRPAAATVVRKNSTPSCSAGQEAVLSVKPVQDGVRHNSA